MASGLDSAGDRRQQVLGQVRRAYATAPRPTRPWAGSCTIWPSERFRWASGSTSRRPSTPPGFWSCPWRWTSPGVAWTGWLVAPRQWWVPVRWAAFRRPSGPGGYRPHRRRQPIAAARDATGGEGPRPRCQCSRVSAGSAERCDGGRRRGGQLHGRCAAGGVAGPTHQALAPAQRDDDNRPLVLCDLGMPRDIDGGGGLPGVSVVDMERILGSRRPKQPRPTRTRRGRSSPPRSPPTWPGSGWQRSHRLSRPASARRRRCRRALLRLENRLHGLNRQPAQRSCAHRSPGCRQAAARPTVRIKQLAGAPGGDSYAERFANCSNWIRRPSMSRRVKLPLLATESDALADGR